MKSSQRHLIALFATSIFSIASTLSANDLPRMPEQVFPALDAVLKDALKQSPRMLLKQLDLTIAEGDLTQAKAGLYPSVGGFYQESKTKDKRQDRPGQLLNSTKTYYSLSLTQPIFHWGERKNNAKIGEIREKIAEKQYREGYRLLAQEIRDAYLSMIAAKCQLASARFSRTLADEALRLGEDRVNKKVIAEGEIFQTRVASEQAGLAVERLESGYAEAKHAYATLTGLPEPDDDQIPDTIPALEYNKDEIGRLLGGFLGQKEPVTPAIDILHQQIDVSDLSYKNSRKTLLPKLNLVAGISQDEQSYTLNPGDKYGVLSKYVGLQVTWTIFDGFASRGAIKSALARKRQAAQNYQIAVDALQHNAQVAARGIDLAYRQMALNDRLLDNSLQFLKYRRDNFKDGRASETDVNNAQAGYNSALVSANSARQDYLLRVSAFVSLIARDPAMQNLDLN
jgi:outer membrane protein TolC